MGSNKILIALEDDKETALLSGLLHEEGFTVIRASSLQEGQDYINNYRFDVVIPNGKSENGNFQLLRAVKAISPDTGVIILGGAGTIEEKFEANKAGADDFLERPYQIQEVRLALNNVQEKINRNKELRSLRDKIESKYFFQDISVKNPKMQQLLKALPKIAESPLNILIKGEIGTGREDLAKTIHQMSPRTEKQFVSIHCADDQLETKLFGYVRGAYRDSNSSQQGLFETSNGGTIFLDQITDIPLPLQLKLFLVLKSGLFGRLGAKDDLQFDARIICASSKDISEAVSIGQFREDLFYKLNLIPLELPPLRERREDIPSLIQAIIRRKATDKLISEDALRILLSQPWKGNLRELESVVERIVLFSDHEVITPADVPFKISEEKEVYPNPPVGEAGFDLDALLEKMEKSCLLSALEKASGNKTDAAKMLNISFRSFRHRLAKYGLQ